MSLVFGYVSMNGHYRDCMVELGSGHAFLNATLPVMLMHPTLLAQLIAMLGQVHALLTALHVAGFNIDPRAWLLRYGVAVMGPYLVAALGYFLVTLSVVWGYVSCKS